MTLVVVGTAIHRLGLYQDAYGLTMLRLACTLFAWWLGAVFLLVAVRLAGVGGSRAWLPMAVVASARPRSSCGTPWGPEALVVRTNVDRAVAGKRFDPTYLSNLSDDAVPAIAAALPRLSAQDRAVASPLTASTRPPTTAGRPPTAARSAADRTRAGLPRCFRDLGPARAGPMSRKARRRRARGPRRWAPGPRGSCSPTARGAGLEALGDLHGEPIIVIGDSTRSAGVVSKSGAAASA